MKKLNERGSFLRILLFFILFGGLYYLLSSQGFIAEEKKQQESKEFTDNINSKTKLLMNLKKSPDVIFIGSSTTKYHVSTNLFKSKDIDIFNYGIEGHYFTTYPCMIQNAIKLQPKTIIISMNVQELYYQSITKEDAFNKNINVEHENLKFFAKHYLENFSSEQEFNLAIKLIGTFIEQREYFARFGYVYTDFIKSFYSQFKPGISPKVFFAEKPPIAPTTPDSTIATGFDKKYLDCAANSSMTNFMGYRCDNGDGIITREDKNLSFTNYHNENVFRDKKYNYVYVGILNKMLDDIKKAGIKPVIIFSPQFENPVYNIALLKKTIHADIIDLTHLQLPKDSWYNSGHLNAKGRYLYSSALLPLIKQEQNLHSLLSASHSAQPAKQFLCSQTH